MTSYHSHLSERTIIFLWFRIEIVTHSWQNLNQSKFPLFGMDASFCLMLKHQELYIVLYLPITQHTGIYWQFSP